MDGRLLDAQEMQRVDAAAIAGGADGYALMCAAGEAVCRAALSLLQETAPPSPRHTLQHIPQHTLQHGSPHRVTVLAGPGNNGGDGAVAARLLRAAGCRVQLLRVGSPPVGGGAARAFADWSGPTVAVDGAPVPPVDGLAGLAGSAGPAGAEPAHLLIDALLGAGLSRPVSGTLATLIEAINADGTPVLAVDLPSGLDGNAHRADGAVVRATATITFVRYKPAHLLYPGRELCGRLMLADIGMPAAALAAVPVRCAINRPAVWRDAVSVPRGQTHKYRRGHLLVRAGDAAHGGAARLSAMTALGCGAGLVTLGCPTDAMRINACHLDAVMLAPLDGVDGLATLLEDPRFTTLLIGPGNGRGATTRRVVERALSSGRDCVLDADALTSHGKERDRLVALLAAAAGQVVLTPHDGEFERLFGAGPDEGAPSRLHRARTAARRSGAVIVSKGADTVVAAPDGQALIACHAPPWLATAGSGDVLAGAIASLLTQGTPAFEAAAAAVWLHGQAARTIGYPMSAETLAGAIPRELGRTVPVPPPLLPAGLPDDPLALLA